MHVRTSYVCQTLMKTTSPEPSCELDPLQVLGLPDLSYLQEGISRRPLYRIRVFSRNCKIAAVTGVYQEVESVSCNTKAAKTGLLGEDLCCQRMHQLVVLLFVLFSSAFVHVPASCGRPLRIAAICLTTLDWLSKGAEEKRWCSMADSPGPDPQDEGEDVDDGDFPFLKADHPAYKRLQEAWRKQLTGHNDRVTLQLREKQEELKKLVKHREDIGVTLYGAQQQLAKLQLQLEQLHDKYAMVQGQRLEDDEKLKYVTSDWEGKKVEVEEATRRLAKSQDELNQLNITVRQVQEYNEQMKAEIQVTRRATYKAEDHIKQIEEMKSKQDLLIDSMNEDIKRLTERKALLDAQIAAQRQETEAAMATLREASREMEAIEFEKKQLMMQWRSSLVGMQRRDEALQNVQKALEEQSEAELAIENEIRGLHSSIRTEQERHEQLCALRDRNDKEMQYLQSQMTSLKQEREKLMDQYSTLNKSMDQHLEETQKLKAGITEQTRSMEVLDRNMQNVSREITAMVGKIEEEQSEQTTCERVTANSRKRMKKIREEIAAKEVETQNLLNEIARVTVDSLNTKAHNQMLKDRHKQLSDELADREKLIEQYEQEIRKRHHQIEKKQLFVDRLNREYDEKRTKLEAELGNDEDVAGPQEAKLKHMRKAINELTKECSEMQKDWIQKQTQLLSISSETDKLKATLNENKNKKMVLEQKKLRIEGQLSSHEKEIKELDNNMKHLRFDMDRMNSALVKNEARSGEISNTNQMMETEFVQKLKEIENRCLDMERDVEKLKLEKDQMNQDILESERQVLLWERKITLEREMQAALDPNVGQSDASAMKKEIHRMELRLEQLKRRQEQTIVEMERAIHKRDAIALKLEPKAQKTKKAASAANVKRQLQSLRNNLKLCTQANSDAEQKISERQRDLAELQQTIEQAAQEYGNLERAGEALRAEVQVGHVEKQQNLASILQLQRTAKRLDELSMGTGPPPPANIQQQHDEQLQLRGKVEEIVRVLGEAYPQLENLWTAFHTWMEVPS
ncbi:Coiled-coil domain-containing protein 40 [Symbiodinium microadriaticum]|uniref:Coiled-coil domain-containing protein 40 n=2 Tax=Symbiodinium TaxID=2949 RepID=A0A1Q9DKC7_SYMMI|nr:Coiled-coil domain-containing protein 40 [Symbiodinium microadriaticum]CAE7442879.1 Ccdc40 [Symbiodinium microadriaticum]CAE7947675.1 Ccdc40 [Symbiodinium sp. KB8]